MTPGPATTLVPAAALKALDPAQSESLQDAREAMEKTLEPVEKAARDDGAVRKAAGLEAATLEKVRMLRALRSRQRHA